ncbi:MAG: RNA polymerase sigma-70 factor [Bacteroidetes bacterium]|nr:RNA polymerase sigma-70 factor [Bacteroidota bacterium]
MVSKDKPSDKQLAGQIKKGQTHAFDQMFDRYSQQLYRFSKSLLKNHEDAEEVVQEVFFRIWKKHDELNERKSFQSFLFSIAYNLIVDKFRQRVKDQKHEQFLIKQAQQNYLNPGKELEYKELKKQINKAITELPKRRKKIYQLNREKGLSYKEIAGRLRIKPKTVENHINLALKHIRKRLGNETLAVALFLSLFI